MNAISLKRGRKVHFKEDDAPNDNMEDLEVENTLLSQMKNGKSKSMKEQQLMIKKDT